MSMAADRRAEGVVRIPFEAMVEVGGSLGPTFEARAVNLSGDGMQIRTPYLPEIGQPITCRFDAGQGMVVVAAGEVLWREAPEGGGDGGEFGVRFTNLDAESARTLDRILGIGDGDARSMPEPGRKIRLHIEGLASPMRARVKDMQETGVTAFSELGFLQMGRPLELEDAGSGGRRAAVIDRIEVEVDRETRIPQLVMSLRYEDARRAEMEPIQVRPDMPSDAPVTIDERCDESEPSAESARMADGEMADEDDDEDDLGDDADVSVPMTATAASESSDDEESANLKSPIARTAAKVTPALTRLADRARIRFAALAAKTRGGSGDDVAVPTRRTTAPAPGGGLHTAGRKVVRGETSTPIKTEEPTARFPLTRKKKLAAGAAVGLASILAIAAMGRSTPAPAPAAEAPAPEVATAVAAAAPAPEPAPIPVEAAKPAPTMPADDPFGLEASERAAATADNTTTKKKKNLKVTPFGSGAIGANGNVLRLKMDGAVERIHGASQPTGFTVVIPGRKSLDAAAPLATKDPRIAAMHVSNEVSGAELSVSFKDGVPGYLVRAKGDVLELVLARPGHATDERPAAARVQKTPTKKRTHKRR